MRTFEEILIETTRKNSLEYQNNNMTPLEIINDSMKKGAVEYAKQALDSFYQDLRNAGYIPNNDTLVAQKWLKFNKNNLK